MSDKELRTVILNFDKSRGETGVNFVTGAITRLQADSKFDDDISKMVEHIKRYGLQENRNLLLRLKQYGHGGGNWRRLVESELAKLDEGEQRKVLSQ